MYAASSRRSHGGMTLGAGSVAEVLVRSCRITGNSDRSSRSAAEVKCPDCRLLGNNAGCRRLKPALNVWFCARWPKWISRSHSRSRIAVSRRASVRLRESSRLLRRGELLHRPSTRHQAAYQFARLTNKTRRECLYAAIELYAGKRRFDLANDAYSN
jgi:hypothetical protein